MSRSRLALICGIVLVAAAFVIPCRLFGDYAGASMPYQDPTSEMLRKQAAEVAALRHELVTRLEISALVGVVGMTALGWGLWTRRQERRNPRPEVGR
ncbi:hypothetical protein HC031_18480 [Planosporangium thailandense]|uniref:Uncharacterized protein n=1 Tax=Planosporangium thailandense TaxID=765197 RepID=A0ABX0Y023_9ACTN|nr:hypothetical protein [Planosporangium thailandense]NJC71691.1 hypothetical protein [Planosporangium thailandense]